MPGKVATLDEWRKARLDLLAKEKEHSKKSDELAKERSELPLLQVDSDYKFTGPNGTVSLSELFKGHRQLIIYHLMFDPKWSGPCKSCCFVVDQMPTHLEHLESRDTTLAYISRAPYEKIKAFKDRMRWNQMPWYSSSDSSFNYDFHASMDENVRPLEYNFASKVQLDQKGESHYTKGEQQGFSVFLRDGDDIYYTYSCYARGSDRLFTTYTLLDMTPLGRQDVVPHVPKFEYHDAY